MPSPLHAPITAYRGESLAHVAFCLFEEPADPLAESTDPRDLTGCSAVLTVWPFRGASTKTLELSTGTGTLEIVPLSGAIIPTASAAVLNAIARGVYYYRVLVTFADGESEQTHDGEFSLED